MARTVVGLTDVEAPRLADLRPERRQCALVPVACPMDGRTGANTGSSAGPNSSLHGAIVPADATDVALHPIDQGTFQTDYSLGVLHISSVLLDPSLDVLSPPHLALDQLVVWRRPVRTLGELVNPLPADAAEP
jgi:hypothetical protein